MPKMREVISAGYPAAIAAAFALTKYLDEGLPLVQGLRAALVAGAAAIVVTALAVLVTADIGGGALLGAALVGLLLVANGDRTMASVLALLVAAIIVRSLLSRLIHMKGSRPSGHTGPGLRPLYRALPILSLLLLAVTIAQFALRGGYVHPARAAVSRISDGPDIYIVLLDGFPRADVLAAYHGRDNVSFIEGLERSEFFVARHSRSNYLSTVLTMTSMLGLSLLHDLPPYVGHASFEEVSPAERRRALQDTRAFALLREHGYETVAFASGYDRTDLRAADRFIDSGNLDLVELVLLRDSGLRILVDLLFPTFATGQYTERIKSNLAGMVSLAGEPGHAPKFVWVHVPAPHDLAMFDSVGEPIAASLVSFFWMYDQEAYLDYVAHLESLTLGAVRQLIAATRGEAVIVLLSDHGSRSGHSVPEAPTPSDVREQTSVLFAAYTPGRAGLFHDTITLVNVLPTLFNAYLGTTLSTQPDRHFALDGRELPPFERSEP